MAAMTLEHRQRVHTPGRKELRTFGLAMAAMLILMFGVVLPWLWGAAAWPLWPWIAAAPFALLALLAPGALGPVYRGWMKIAGVLGWINTRLVLGLAFFAMIFPTGLIMRLLGKDPMARKLDRDADSYRVARAPRASHRHMEKPY